MTEELPNIDDLEECDVCKNYISLSSRPIGDRLRYKCQQFQETSAEYLQITSKYGLPKTIECNLLFWNKWARNGEKCIKKYQNQRSNGFHHAIIVVNNVDRNIFSKNKSIFAGGIDLLINHFVKKPITPFQIYLCKDPKKFENVIINPNTKNLWIFGHGDRHGVDFGNRVYYPYCRLSSVSTNKDLKKDFIAQLHCSSGEGKALWEYLSDNQGIFSGKYRYLLENREDIKEWIKQHPKDR